MRRIFTLLFAFTALAGVAIWLVDHPGRIAIDWQGWRVDASLLVLVLLIVALLVSIWLLARFWMWLKTGHALSPEKREKRRLIRGLSNLDGALNALAIGDAKTSSRLAGEAIKRLPDNAVAYALAAQAAKARNDQKQAQIFYDQMRETTQGKLIALRADIQTARESGALLKAHQLAMDVQKDAPKSGWAALQAFEASAAACVWDDAANMLEKARKLGAISSSDVDHHRAALLYNEATQLEADGEAEKAYKTCVKAVKLRPDFTPATVLAARLSMKQDRISRASKLIEQAWAVAPHPRLAEIYALLKPDEGPDARFKRFEKLANLKPDHRESQLQLAEVAITSGQIDKARTILAPLLTGQIAARTAKLMLAASKHADETEQAHWASLAVHGVEEPLWSCQSCGTQRARWQPNCPSCHAFNRFQWGDNHPDHSHMRDDETPLLGGSF